MYIIIESLDYFHQLWSATLYHSDMSVQSVYHWLACNLQHSLFTQRVNGEWYYDDDDDNDEVEGEQWSTTSER